MRGHLRRTWLLVAAAICHLAAPADDEVCSSLGGPRCRLVNGLVAPGGGAPAATAPVSSSWRERLLGLVASHLAQGLEAEDGVEPISGARGRGVQDRRRRRHAGA